MATTSHNQSLSPVAKSLRAVGDIMTGHNKFNLSPVQLSRLGAVALTSVTLAAVKELIPTSAAPQQNTTSQDRVVYPRYSEAQLRALPDQKVVTAQPGDGPDALIAKADPGLLGSTVPGSPKMINELEDIVGQEAPGGIVQAGAEYTVPQVGTEIAPGK